MAELSEKAKQTIDQLSEEELRLEFNKGHRSRFQKEKFAYVKLRLQQIEEQRQQQQHTQQNSCTEQQINISQKSLKLSALGVFVAMLALVVSIFALSKSHWTPASAGVTEKPIPNHNSLTNHQTLNSNH